MAPKQVLTHGLQALPSGHVHFHLEIYSLDTSRCAGRPSRGEAMQHWLLGLPKRLKHCAMASRAKRCLQNAPGNSFIAVRWRIKDAATYSSKLLLPSLLLPLLHSHAGQMPWRYAQRKWAACSIVACSHVQPSRPGAHGC